jgi:hypothetical protein
LQTCAIAPLTPDKRIKEVVDCLPQVLFVSGLVVCLVLATPKAFLFLRYASAK